MNNTPTGSGSPLMITLAATIFVVSVAALTILEIQGRNVTALLGLVTPVITALLVGHHLAGNQTTSNKIHSRKLDSLEHQLNGALEPRITRAVTQALASQNPESENEHQALDDR